jgi:molybdenum cofactor cytidylyltransferase
MSSAHMPTVLVLASGRGERFTASGGQGSKLQALLGGRTVLAHTLAAVRASGLPFHVEDAGHPGMGDSIAHAVRATPGAQGWLILPADLPLISANTLRQVATALQSSASDHTVAYPLYQGQRGHPVGFGPAHFAALAALHGKHGAACVMAGQTAIELIVTDKGCVTDIDTLADLAHAQTMLPSTG